ncbi:hypothetical protein EDB92DRAFT_1867306 [Lactarius akahatsu]|uniref:Uncharacterized protein n=1 Tax=Lactarius akahatsu TaxID=416441 RepID=A0AAD4LFG8_9AGAM|nr:hypothetical protein EDB92DRAFT_1867306 [Lactarius akahatsu]
MSSSSVMISATFSSMTSVVLYVFAPTFSGAAGRSATLSLRTPHTFNVQHRVDPRAASLHTCQVNVQSQTW